MWSLDIALILIQYSFVSSPTGPITITVKAEPGQKVTLPCEDPDQRKILFAEWKRTDLGSKYVLLYRDNGIATDGQHPSYKDRVELIVYQLTFGDASLILKNVTITDSGTYECRVLIENSGIKVISTANLDVLPPG
uniref:Ig-like domain-containing protein n=1 Tax=Poecilia formosa TaxID=48698 RepID=A0A096MCM1_POEFO